MAKRNRSDEAAGHPAPKQQRRSTSSQADVEQLAQSPQHNIGYLDLPPEVRNTIYKYVLTAETGKIKVDIPPVQFVSLREDVVLRIP
jgi:hypothetical protein